MKHCGLQGEKVRRAAVVEPRPLGNKRPKTLDHAPGQSADRQDVDAAADVSRGSLPVGL